MTELCPHRFSTKVRKSGKEEERTVVFRTARELLYDYATGEMARFARPAIVWSGEREGRCWAVVDGADAGDFVGIWPVCDIGRLNCWLLSRIGILEGADLPKLLDLGQQLEYFLVYCLIDGEIVTIDEDGFSQDDVDRYRMSNRHYEEVLPGQASDASPSFQD
jgi:hypothetical protein